MIQSGEYRLEVCATELWDGVYARGNGTHIAEVCIGGRTVVEAGRVIGIDEAVMRAELLARMRAALAADAGHGGWRATVQALAQDLAPFYRDGRFGGCCG